MARAGVRATAARVQKLGRVIGQARRDGEPIWASIQGLLDQWSKKPQKRPTSRKTLKEPVSKPSKPFKLRAPGEPRRLSGIEKLGFQAGAAWINNRGTGADYRAAESFARAVSKFNVGGNSAKLTEIKLGDGTRWEISIPLEGDTKSFKHKAIVLPRRATRFGVGWYYAVSREPVTRGEYLPHTRFWTELSGTVEWKGFYRVGSRTLEIRDRMRRGTRVQALHTSHAMMRFNTVVNVERTHYREIERNSRTSDEPTTLESIAFVVRYYSTLRAQ